MLKYIGVCLLALISQVSFAADSETVAKIDSFVLIDTKNLVRIYPEGGVQNPPACHGWNGDYISFSMSRPMGKEYLDSIIYAHSENKTVTLTTFPACADETGTVTLHHIKVHKD
ncbi:hypothetical protein [Microbulbifer sp. JMSA003]|uniref:hypothetical protein n=1 Tax=unclassified Microbulbifer TaxID=2619833 RepID=UPI00403A4D72